MSRGAPASLTNTVNATVISGYQYTLDAVGNHRQVNQTEQLPTIPVVGQSAYAYDSDNRMTNSEGQVQGFDANGNMLSISGTNLLAYDYENRLTQTSFAGTTNIYQYDGARNLRAIVSTGPDGATVAGYRYTLDPNGNRTAVSALEPNTNVTKPASGTTTYSFDANNHPISRTDGATYRYDARGNLAAIAGPVNLTFTYDFYGRLNGYSGDTASSSSYDSTGLRTIRNGRRLVYDLSGGLSGERPRVAMETDTGNAPVAWYIYGLGLLWVMGDSHLLGT